ncbi:MAG TPA: hypothetical protein VEX62_00155, partial [Candidatus Limnocylindrales bacterium]|nr:hypothetical protein [Candidatus Limnocylindrales bacterium]
LITGTNASHFQVDANNCAGETLVPDETCTIDVIFDPSTTGSKVATLRISSNDPDENPVDRALSGNGSSTSPGTIIIRLDTVPNHKTDFTYTGDLGTFKLDDDGNGTLPNQRVFSSLAPGEYEITQSTINNFQLINLQCTTGETTNIATRKLTIDLTSGETVDCTFTNARRKPDARVATSSGGTLKGNNIYSTTPGSSQALTHPMTSNQVKSFYFSLQNDGNATDDFTVDGNVTGSSSFSVQFFNGATNITAAVLAGTYQVNDLAANAAVVIRAQVTAAPSTPGSATAKVDVYFTAAGSTQTDVARGKVT